MVTTKIKSIHLLFLFLIIFVLPILSCKSVLDISNDIDIPGTKSEMVFSPTLLSPTTDIGNPGRGYYQWNSIPLLSTLPIFDIYDRFSWRELEISEGVYDFLAIDKKMAELKKGQRFSFRVMALNTCCTGYKNGADVPDYIVNEKLGWFYSFHNLKNSDSIFIPDWNDSRLLDRMEKFIQALADRFDNDPRIGWIETGMYGNWAEWHTYPIQYPNSSGVYAIPQGTPISNPMYAPLYAPIMKDPQNPNLQKYRVGSMLSMQKILFAHTNAFKHKQLIQSTSNLPILFDALNVSSNKPLGVRRDSWGHPSFSDITLNQNYKPSKVELELFYNRWKTAPFYTENWGGSYIGDDEMLTQLRNFNVSAIAYGNMGTWTEFSKTVQDTYLKCGCQSGYRYQVSKVAAELNDSNIYLSTSWKNVNMAPSYENWVVQAYIINPKTGVLFSEFMNIPINLKDLLNENVMPIPIDISLPIKADWKNEKILHFRIIVKDSDDYLNPLNLDMTGQNPDGSYTLFIIEIINGIAKLKRYN